MKGDDDWLTPMQALALKIMEDQKRAQRHAVEEFAEVIAQMGEEMKASFLAIGQKIEDANKAMLGLAKVVGECSGHDELTVREKNEDGTWYGRPLAYSDLVNFGAEGDSDEEGTEGGEGGTDGIPGGGGSGSGRSDGVVGSTDSSGGFGQPGYPHPGKH